MARKGYRVICRGQGLTGGACMPSNYWLKLYHETLHDPKMQRLTDRLYRRVIELFLLAGDTANEGHLPSIDDMAWHLRTEPGELLAEMQELAGIGILTETEHGWLVTHFAERQSPMPDAERQRRRRDRSHKEEYYSHERVTPCDTSRHEPVTASGQIRLDKIRSDVEETAAATPPAQTGPPKRAPPKPRKKRQSKASDARTQHPAIQAVRELTNRYPPKPLWDDIIKLLGDEPRIDDMATCYKEWVKRGYKVTNTAWLFEWYVSGIPARQVGRPAVQQETADVINRYKKRHDGEP